MRADHVAEALQYRMVAWSPSRSDYRIRRLVATDIAARFPFTSTASILYDLQADLLCQYPDQLYFPLGESA